MQTDEDFDAPRDADGFSFDRPEPDDGGDGAPRRRERDAGRSWPRRDGVLKSWRPPSWAADNSTRL